MSEIVNSATIKVGVETDGAVNEIRKLDDATTKVGRTVDNLGKSAGFKEIGAGPEQAAGHVGRTTPSIIASIQRTTSALEMGKRGTAEYYSQLANSRGANLAQLEPYINQLREVTSR